MHVSFFVSVLIPICRWWVGQNCQFLKNSQECPMDPYHYFIGDFRAICLFICQLCPRSTVFSLQVIVFDICGAPSESGHLGAHGLQRKCVIFGTEPAQYIWSQLHTAGVSSIHLESAPYLWSQLQCLCSQLKKSASYRGVYRVFQRGISPLNFE